MSTTLKKLIVLIHGAGQNSSVWRDLQTKLDSPSFAVDFPNRYPSKVPNTGLGFEDYVDHIITQIKAKEFEQLVIITHSLGGVLGLKVANHFSKQVTGFVALSSAIPKKGGSFCICLPFPQKIILPIILQIAGTKPPATAIVDGICNDLSESQIQDIVTNFTPESRLVFTQKSHATLPHCDKLYIKLTQDKEFPMAMQDQMAKNLDANFVETIDAGHLAMLSQPDKLAKIINNFVAQL
jgi:pimeloyl-ACP methyl ester carboxylesterase